MRRQLVIVAAATTSLVALAFLIPLALLLDRVAQNRAETAAERDAQALAPVLAITEDPVKIELAVGNTEAGADGRLSVVLPDDRVIGGPFELGPSVERARTGEAFSATVSGGREVLTPIGLSDGRTLVVRVLVTDGLLHRGVWRAWLVLAVLGIALVLLAIGVADRLGRAVVRPVAELAEAARRLGRGDLGARVAPTGPPEIVEVGRAFNRLAVRIADLLAQERELVADLSHRLRTPLTALALDAEGVGDVDLGRRLSDDIAEVERVVDRIIAEARRPMRQGVGVTADLGDVVRSRVEFWSALADEQGRTWALQVAPGPHPVPVHPADLEAAIDALIGNVFSHTDEQVGFRVAVVGTPGGPSLLILDDNGAGFSRNGGGDSDGITGLVERGVSRGGSSGLGLDIARRTAESAGGRLRLANRHAGGARVELEFPAPQP